MSSLPRDVGETMPRSARSTETVAMHASCTPEPTQVARSSGREGGRSTSVCTYFHPTSAIIISSSSSTLYCCRSRRTVRTRMAATTPASRSDVASEPVSESQWIDSPSSM